MPNLPQWRESVRARFTWRRILVALAVVLLLHLVFFFGIAPYLLLDKGAPARTEVVEISQEQLQKLKKEILTKNKKLPLQALMKQELHEELKSKEAPKDATMMAPFNQVVPKQQVAGPRPDTPLEGGGAKAREQARRRSNDMPRPQEKLNLAKLGLGNHVAPPPPPQTLEEQIRERSQQGPPGPPGPFRPRGLDAKDIERGDQNMLNAVESEYYSFFARFNEPIIRNWYFLMNSSMSKLREEMARAGAKEGSTYFVTIEFVLDRQGNFKSITVVESSQLATMDHVTRSAVAKLGSLPNPPAGLFENGEYFTHQMRFALINEAATFGRPEIYW